MNEKLRPHIQTEISLNDIQTFEAAVPQLQAEIASKSGILLALIHPFYMQIKDENLNTLGIDELINTFQQQETGFGYELPKGNQRLLIPEQSRSRINSMGYFSRLKNMLKAVPVLLVGEEKRYQKKSFDLLRALGFSGTILWYPTTQTSPNPDAGLTYEDIANRLEQLQCKKVVAAGQLHLPTGCVTSFVDNVSEHTSNISFLISPITYPYHEM